MIDVPLVTHAVKIDNPPLGAPAPPPAAVVNLALDFDGKVSRNGIAVDRQTLQAYITQPAVKDPQPEMQITVDKFAKYNDVF